MEHIYNILLVEDSPEDASLNRRIIKKALNPCRFKTVETEEAFNAALNAFAPDVIVSDFAMPRFSGLSVLRLVQGKAPFTPVIIVTGSIDEETAVACIKAGAADYILKVNLKRLGPALLTALKQKDARLRHYETQRALLDSEENYRVLFENDPAGNFVTDAAGVITACNRSFASALGFRAPTEALGANFFGFCRVPGEYEDFLQLISGRRTVEHYKMELAQRDGETVHAVVTAYGTFSADHALEGIAGFIINETERRRLEERLALAQKMESLGTLAGGVAHDFNNILNIIIGYLSLLEKSFGDRDIAAHYIETIGGAAERGAALVRQLLAFARKTEPRLDPVLFSDVLDDVTKLARETFPRTIEFRYKRDSASRPVTADADQLHQVFLNLFVNARDAMPEGGVITVTCGNVERRVVAAKYPGTEGNEYSFARVEDTGTGMDEEMRKRIFEPFFSTKGRERGTGLGLAQVYGIIKQHRGFIEVESETGKGSTFTVYLPARGTDNTPSRDRPAAAHPVGGCETILLAEDEETLRQYMSIVLRSRGYRVLEAVDGSTALELFHNRRKDIDVFLIDFGLPKLDGGELLRRITVKDSGAMTILMSGFLDPNLKPFMAETGVSEFLQKPFTPEALLAAIRRVIDARRSRNAGDDDKHSRSREQSEEETNP